MVAGYDADSRVSGGDDRRGLAVQRVGVDRGATAGDVHAGVVEILPAFKKQDDVIEHCSECCLQLQTNAQRTAAAAWGLSGLFHGGMCSENWPPRPSTAENAAPGVKGGSKAARFTTSADVSSSGSRVVAVAAAAARSVHAAQKNSSSRLSSGRKAVRHIDGRPGPASVAKGKAQGLVHGGGGPQLIDAAPRGAARALRIDRANSW